MRDDGHSPSIIDVKLGNEQLLRAGLGPTNVMVTCEEHGQQPRHVLLARGRFWPVCVKCVMAYIVPEMVSYVGPSSTGH